MAIAWTLSLRIIGWSKPHLEAGIASTSLLFQTRDSLSSVLVDCGHGATSEILKLGCLRHIEHIVITHFHPDHWMDLFALKNACLAEGLASRFVSLHLPRNGSAVLAEICGAMSIGASYFSDYFAIQEYASDVNVEAGEFDLQFFPTHHSVVTHGVRLRNRTSGKVMTFTSDTAPFINLASHVSNSELLIIECNTLERIETEQGHMACDDIIDLLRQVNGVKSLCITHYPLRDRSRILSRLSAALPSISVMMAETGLALDA